MNPDNKASSSFYNLPLATSGVFLGLYVMSLSPNLGAAHDSIYYLRSIETGVALLHPHHLIYNAVGRGWTILTGLDAAVAVPLLNALFGAATIFLLHRLLIETAGAISALFWTLLYAASFGPWFYSSMIEVYILPLPFLIVAFRLATRARPTPGAAIGAGALLGIAILGHQTNALLLPALLWPLRRAPRRLPILLMAAAAATAGIPYLLAARNAGESLAHWSTLYLRELDLGAFTLMTLPKAAVGIGRFFIGGHFVFAFDRLPGLESLLAGHHLADERFLVREMPAAVAATLALLAIAWFVALGVLLGRAGRQYGKLLRGRESILPPTIWFGAYAIFFTWWEPANVEFWIATMIPAFIVGARVTGNIWSKTGDSILVFETKTSILSPVFRWFILPILLFMINALGSIAPLTRVENDYYRARASEIIASGESISPDEWIIGPYVERGKNR
jgi:hypothetical protein